MAYVGTFSSPLRDVLPTQVDLPPGNGRGIHLFQVDRATGAMTPAGIYDLGTSPSCLALNAAGTRLYSANETDRVGDDKEGTISAFAIDRADGTLELLNTVRFGRGRADLCQRSSVRTISASWPTILAAPSRCCRFCPTVVWATATDIKNDAGKLGPTRATNAPPGSFAFSGHDRTHAHMIQADPAGRFVLHVDLGLDQDFRLEVRRAEGRADGRMIRRRFRCRRETDPGISIFIPTAAGSIPFRRKARPSSCLTTMPRKVGWLHGRRSPRLPPGFAGSNFCSEILVSADGRVRLCGQPPARQHWDLFDRPRTAS